MQIDTTDSSINSFFDRKIANIYPSKEALIKALKSGKQLKFYLGADTSNPNLHIGHIIPYLKMAQLQKMGHKIIFLIGDFTGMVGDPTDKTATRRQLTLEEVKHNAESFVSQIQDIFDFNNKENPVEIKFNSEWNSKLTFLDVINLCSNFTVQQMLERDMFEKRIKDNKPIHLHEFLYPVIQGYDSVAMDVDGEFGGTDQTFNMLSGRTLMKTLKGKEKLVITVNLLLSSDGVNKMSKSIGNCIFLKDTKEDKFGKIMAIPDSLILHYYELLSNLNDNELDDIKKQIENNENLMGLKKDLAKMVVAMIDGEQAANEANIYFEKTVQNKEIPDDIPNKNKHDIIQSLGTKINIKDLLVHLSLVSSNSEAKRLVTEGAIEINHTKIQDTNTEIDLNQENLIKYGKRKWILIN